jgi:RNA polymerase subunit RPABC4/transcription elongation factor Spt4
MKQKECPSCAMEIPEDSKICPVCGYEFPEKNKKIPVILAIVLIILLFYLLIKFQ